MSLPGPCLQRYDCSEDTLSAMRAEPLCEVSEAVSSSQSNALNNACAVLPFPVSQVYSGQVSDSQMQPS